jgi:RNA polymerase sigma-70 factor (ECF subfamily)
MGDIGGYISPQPDRRPRPHWRIAPFPVVSSTRQKKRRSVGPLTTLKAAVQACEQQYVSLIAHIARGDQRAFAALYDATSAFVYGLALRILREQSAAEEVTIDVYMQVYRQASHYDSRRGTPSAWLLTLTRSRAIDTLRKRALRQQHETSLALVETLPISTIGPEAWSTATELQRIVQSALAALSPEQRQVIEIVYYEGLSHGKIAARLEQPLGTVKSRIRAGMRLLRELLQPLLTQD